MSGAARPAAVQSQTTYHPPFCSTGSLMLDNSLLPSDGGCRLYNLFFKLIAHLFPPSAIKTHSPSLRHFFRKHTPLLWQKYVLKARVDHVRPCIYDATENQHAEDAKNNALNAATNPCYHVEEMQILGPCAKRSTWNIWHRTV